MPDVIMHMEQISLLGKLSSNAGDRVLTVDKSGRQPMFCRQIKLAKASPLILGPGLKTSVPPTLSPDGISED